MVSLSQEVTQKDTPSSKSYNLAIACSRLSACDSLIPQRFSWGRLQITPEAFERIRLEKRISPSILHILRQFGSTICDKLPQTCSFQGNRLEKQTHTYGITRILYFEFQS
jgi:hypothetical protein